MALSADLPRPPPCLLVFRPARRPACPADAATHSHLLLRRAQGLLSRLFQSFTALCRRREPAPRAQLPSARAREPASYAPLHRRREPAPGVPLLSASAREPAYQAPPSPATRRAIARLLRLDVAPFVKGVLLLHLPATRWRSVLRCGEADSETPRSWVQLDSAFRNCGGRSTLFPVREGSTRLATSPPFPSRPIGRKPSPVGTLSPPTGALLLMASIGSAGPLSPSRTLPHVRSAPLATVEQKKPDTARRASGNSMTSGQINRAIIPLNTEESQLSSRRTASEPTAPLGRR